jgi:outer membrane protein OmpA-like peptidoglycan-associated protein
VGGGRVKHRAALMPEPLRQASELRRDLTASRGLRAPASLRARLPSRPLGELRAAGSDFGSSERAADRLAGSDPSGPALGTDFSELTLHADAAAQRAAALLRAHAFTVGDHVFLGASLGSARDAVLRHEAAHVLEQRARGEVRLQPKLIASGDPAEIERFMALAEPAMGEDLEHDPATGEINAVGSLQAGAASPAFGALVRRIITDPDDNAELSFGRGQPRVLIGAFPDPGDMTGANTAQRIDLDDVEAVEADAPGNGLAALTHEIAENYAAHRNVKTMGGALAKVDQFRPAHAEAEDVQSNVAEDSYATGRRVASAKTPEDRSLRHRVAVDFEHYYVVLEVLRVGTDLRVDAAHQAERVNELTIVVDGFASSSAALPASAAAALVPVGPRMRQRPLATVRIEGFTDSQGGEAVNQRLSRDRAEAVRAALATNGIDEERMSAVGRGASAFAAPNDTEADRLRNRRAVVRVDRPKK